MSDTAAKELHEYMMAVSAAYRLTNMQPPLRVDGKLFELRKYPYLWELYDDEETPDVTIMKGAQMGFTTLMVLRTLDRAGRIYPRGVLYLFPTRDDVADFSRTRFSRVIDDNPTLSAKLEDTDSANLKKINGCFIYFRGAKSRSALKSIPVDMITYDEFDEMEPEMVALADERLSGSEFKHKFRLSTPTVPEFQIHNDYLAGDQRRWLIKCEGCGREAALEDDFPECIRSDDERAWRACVKCDKELQVAWGRWVPAFPKRTRRSYAIAQLCSPTVDLVKTLQEWSDPKTIIQEFYNSKLGQPYADIEKALDDAALLACCGPNMRRLAHEGPSFAGVDVGQKHFYYVAGSKKSESYARVHAFHRVDSLQDIHDLNQRYNVIIGVMDAGAETRTVRTFVRQEPGWWGCMYTNMRQSGGYLWDNSQQMVTVNRTESLDDSHRMIVNRQVEFPRADETFRELVMPQMKNLVRLTKVERDTKDLLPFWAPRGRKDDDFRHAFNYACIAASQAPVESATGRAGRRTPATSGSFMSA